VLFVTLTQEQRPAAKESAQFAYDRLQRSWRRMTNTKTSSGRNFAAHFAGGAKAIELAWSPAGKRNKDGKYKAFSGWHPHFHCLMEVRPGVDKADAIRTLFQLWATASPGARPGAQHVVEVDDNRVGQVCKYPLKLPELDKPKIIRAAATVLADKKTIIGFGSWRSFLSAGRELRDAKEPRPTAKLRLADQRLGTLIRREGVVTFTHPTMKQSLTIALPVRLVRESVLRDPRTFAQRDKARADFEEQAAAENAERRKVGMPDLVDVPPPMCPERRKMWDEWAPRPVPKLVKQSEPEPEPAEQMELSKCPTFQYRQTTEPKQRPAKQTRALSFPSLLMATRPDAS
jgi:hypothetical protein